MSYDLDPFADLPSQSNGDHKKMRATTRDHVHNATVTEPNTTSPKENTSSDIKLSSVGLNQLSNEVVVVEYGDVSVVMTPHTFYHSQFHGHNDYYKLRYKGDDVVADRSIKSLLEKAYVELFHGNPKVNGSMDERCIKEALPAIKIIYDNFYPLDTDNGPKTNSNGNIVSLALRAKVAGDNRPFVKVRDQYFERISREVDIYVQRSRVDPDVNSALFYKTTVKVASLFNGVEVTKQFHHYLEDTPNTEYRSHLIESMINAVFSLCNEK